MCEFCGVKFSAHRSDTRFCCDAHRIAYFRWRTKLSALEIRAHHNIATIQEYLAFPEANRAANDVLQGISERAGTKADAHKGKD